jgi:hypothetical protein
MAYNVGEGELRITDGMQDSIGRYTPSEETQGHIKSQISSTFRTAVAITTTTTTYYASSASF